MRVVFMGFQTWGYRVLEALVESRHTVALVITHANSDHEYEAIWADSVEKLARGAGIPCLVRRQANDEETRAAITAAEPDILVSSNWRTWVAAETYGLARHGAINIHESLLPRYGGFAPLNWALLNGEAEVGVTVHFMNEEFDLGDIVLQHRVPVAPTDTATDLFFATIALFPRMTLAALDLIASGRRDWQPQDPDLATFFHKRSVEDSRILWDQPAQHIVNLVRAQSDPYPSAFTFSAGRRVEVLRASVSGQRYGGTPGRVFRPVGDGVVIVCGPQARSGQEHGVVLELLRTDDGEVHTARSFFPRMGGYLTVHS